MFIVDCMHPSYNYVVQEPCTLIEKKQRQAASL